MVGNMRMAVGRNIVMTMARRLKKRTMLISRMTIINTIITLMVMLMNTTMKWIIMMVMTLVDPRITILITRNSNNNKNSRHTVTTIR